MQQNANVAAQERFGQAINSGDFSAFDEIVASDILDHDPAPEQSGGPDGYKAFFGAFRQAFPDLKISIDHLVKDDDNVAIAYTATGTHRGEFLGHAPTGKAISVRGMQIARFRDGKMVERWGSSDELGILKQIGAA
ncbi:MAG: ester cyclase [Candidatus Baltobacteraceae bacterium]